MAAARAWDSLELFAPVPWAWYWGTSGEGRRLVHLSPSMSETGRPGQLFAHLICLRDKASFDTDSRQLLRMGTHTNTGRLTNACTHMEMNHTNTRLCWEPLTLGPGSSGDTD